MPSEGRIEKISSTKFNIIEKSWNIYGNHHSEKLNLFFLLQDIVVCLHADKSSAVIGLRNFVMPLRASSLRRHELSVIIFITNLQYIEKEWDMLATFPDIYILNVRYF